MDLGFDKMPISRIFAKLIYNLNKSRYLVKNFEYHNHKCKSNWIRLYSGTTRPLLFLPTHLPTYF